MRKVSAKKRPLTARVELHSWLDFEKVMDAMRTGEWIYRGHEDAGWKLESGLDRQVNGILKIHKEWKKDVFAFNLPRAEFFAISKFREMAKNYLDLDSDASALIAMQHYGAKTRLLDFTMSIMVALFFAYENRLTGNKRAIYAIDYKSLMNQNGVWSGYQSFLERLGDNKDKKGKIDREKERVWWNLESQFENHYFQQYTIEAANANIWSCAYGAPKGVIPLYKPAYNGRQTAQAGIELMPYTFDGFVDNLADALGISTGEINDPTRLVTRDVSRVNNLELLLPSKLVKLVFDPNMEEDAWQFLDQANINAATVYPDIEGVAKSVRYSDRIVLGSTKVKNVADKEWANLENAVRQTFPVGGEQDIVKFLEEMKVGGLDFRRLGALQNLLVLNKSKSKKELPIGIGEADVQFIKDVVAQIRGLETIANIVIPLQTVLTCTLDSAIRPIVEKMVTNSYSHVPVLDADGKVIGVFSEGTMLEMNKAGIGNDESTVMRDIAAYLPADRHTADVFRFVPKDVAVLHLRFLCDDALKKRERIGMFFVTENGKKEQPLIGILTVWDIAGSSDVSLGTEKE